jgi:hypothetical protein
LSRGFGFLRRKTATSCRSTDISAFFEAEDRVGDTGRDSNATSNAQIGLTNAIAHHHRSRPVAEFQKYCRRRFPGLRL